MNKRAPPAAAHHKPGATWWGRRWIEVLEHGSRDMVVRLGKGRAYARDGYVRGLKVRAGEVRATVTDDELDSHVVTLNLEAFDNATWRRILHAMGSQAMNAAQLLNGEMPREIDQVFRACGKSLFPMDHHEVDADCSCEDWTSPCKHIAATHYVLGDAFDQDPFLLFELRGRSKEQILGALDRLRLRSAEQFSQAAGDALAGDELACDALGRVDDTPASCPLSSLPADLLERGIKPLPHLSFHFDVATQPDAGMALLRSLGKPASWNVATEPHALLEPALRQAQQLALELATGSGQVALPRTSLPTIKRRAKK